MQLGYEQNRRQREALQAAFLTGLLKRALVQSEHTSLERSVWVQSIAKEIKRLTDAKDAAVLDFRAFQVRNRLQSRDSASDGASSASTSSSSSSLARKVIPISVDGDFAFESIDNRSLEQEAAHALANFEMVRCFAPSTGPNKSPS